MNLTKILLGAGILLALVSGIASGKEAAFGPCNPSSSKWAKPGSCEYDCWFVCDDPVSYVTVTPGGCQGSYGYCQDVKAKYPKSVNRDCDCPFLGGLCTDEGMYNSGGQWTDHCLGNGDIVA